MNRAERRRAEREKAKVGVIGHPPVIPGIREAVTQAVMRKQDRDEAVLMASGPVLESIYAAAVILLTEDYGFDHDKCVKFLKKIEDKTLYCIEHSDILDEAFEKTGIRIHFAEGIDRIEERA